MSRGSEPAGRRITIEKRGWGAWRWMVESPTSTGSWIRDQGGSARSRAAAFHRATRYLSGSFEIRVR